MAGKRRIRTEEEKAIMHETGHLEVDTARRLGISRSQLSKWRQEDGIPYPKVELDRTPIARPEHTTEELVGWDKKEAIYKAEIAGLKSKNRLLIKETNLHEEVLEVAKEILPRLTPAKIKAPHIGESDTKEDAILAWADWHGGEIIDYEVMEGLNRYTPEIMCRRVQATVDTTLELLFDNHKGTTFGTLYIFDLGDSITGDLLEDNKSTNAMGVFQSMAMVARVKAQAIGELAAHIPVKVVSIPGNHGRRKEKMPWKQPTETADWLIAEMTKAMCDHLDNVEFVIPQAWSAVIEINGHLHSLNHGYSAARGGYGGIPFYAFQRADGKKTSLDAARGTYINNRWYGHIHTPAELPKMDGNGTQFIVASLKGGDEYALNELNAFSRPGQKLVGCHNKFGVTWKYDLQVSHKDDTASRYEDIIDYVMGSVA